MNFNKKNKTKDQQKSKKWILLKATVLTKLTYKQMLQRLPIPLQKAVNTTENLLNDIR